jgi:uncharacterized protein YrzB (UPF0473 family)
MEEQIIETIDEDGNKVSLKLVDIVNVDDLEYALLTDVEEEAELKEGEEAEIVLMRLKREDGEYIFETIDDDDEFDLVAQAIIDEQEDDEE